MPLPRCTISETAQQDIDDIIEYIFNENPRAAFTLEADIYKAFETISDHPAIGHSRSDLTGKRYRFWTVRQSYLIIYAHELSPRIIRVLSGYQDIATILEDSNW
jgi:plasmid stabilization system protein ParE